MRISGGVFGRVERGGLEHSLHCVGVDRFVCGIHFNDLWMIFPHSLLFIGA